jgi:hypothetical protein
MTLTILATNLNHLLSMLSVRRYTARDKSKFSYKCRNCEISSVRIVAFSGMKHLIFIALCVVGGAVAARFRPQPAAISKPQKVVEPQVVDGRQLPLAEPCDPQKCAAPHCRCSQHTLDFDKTPLDKTPQLVMLTFDDAVTALNAPFFEEAIEGRTNPDGCPVAATFYVSHEYTDYSMVHNLWSQGHEIALHSIT